MVTRLVAVFALAAVQAAAAAELRELRGREAQAIAVAVTAFKRGPYSPSHDLVHFAVELERKGQQLEVTFIPDDPHGPSPTYVGTGGSTTYGQEVSFYVSLRSLKIVRWHLAR
jgi:hypothetical protein